MRLLTNFKEKNTEGAVLRYLNRRFSPQQVESIIYSVRSIWLQQFWIADMHRWFNPIRYRSTGREHFLSQVNWTSKFICCILIWSVTKTAIGGIRRIGWLEGPRKSNKIKQKKVIIIIYNKYDKNKDYYLLSYLQSINYWIGI